MKYLTLVALILTQLTYKEKDTLRREDHLTFIKPLLSHRPNNDSHQAVQTQAHLELILFQRRHHTGTNATRPWNKEISA